jgi:predicted enzyme related to lactoylglutathione lyase
MKSIEVISIPVENQENSKAFYLKLGFQVVLEKPFDHGQKWVQMAFPGQSNVSITLVTWFPNMPPGSINGFVIKTDDIEWEKTELAAKGITTGQVEQTPWGRFLSVSDPDGNKLSLHQE